MILNFIKLNNNVCDQIYNEAQIHFTKSCPNKCVFCIDALNDGLVCGPKPDIDSIFTSLISVRDKIDEMTISGGEPFAYINELLTLVRRIKRYMPSKKLSIITSMPYNCWKDKDKFFEIINLVDSLTITPQHKDLNIGDAIRGSKSKFDRNALLKEIPYKNKVSLTINLVRNFLDTRTDLISNINFFEAMGYSHFKIAEMFNRDELYISIEDILGIRLGHPFSTGCVTRHYDMTKFIPGTKSDFTLKRSCFLVCQKCKSHFSDMIKMAIRQLFTKKYFFCVIYENGTILPYWV